MWQYQGNVESSTILEHSGKLGMKWGIRTHVYSKNSIGDKFSNRQQSTMTKRAGKMLKKYEKKDQHRADRIFKGMNKQYDKSYIMREKSTRSKSQKKKKYYNNKRLDFVSNAEQAFSNGSSFVKRANETGKLIKNINNGTLKAGKDFVTNWDVSSMIIGKHAAGSIRIKRTIDFK